MELPIVIYWAINMLLFAFIYGTYPIIPFFIWTVFFMCVWVYEGSRYSNYIQKKYPDEHSAVIRRNKSLRNHFKLSASTEDQELRINQRRIKQVIVSLLIWFVLVPIVLVLGVI